MGAAVVAEAVIAAELAVVVAVEVALEGDRARDHSCWRRSLDP